MPILWRYALHRYLRVFFLSLCTFAAVLLVSRFKEVARFTALSGSYAKTGLFLVYQIPFILPMAIPISALIASFLLFQSLSKTHELSAFRASGISIQNLLAPLLFTSALFALFHFSISAELIPFCRREIKELLYKDTAQNPLLLLQKQHLLQIKNAYLSGGTADPTLIIYNGEDEYLISAKNLRLDEGNLMAEDVAIASYLKKYFVIENMAFLSTDASPLSTVFKKGSFTPNAKSLSMKMLRLLSAQKEHKMAAEAFVELLRRAFLSLSVFSFTLLGCSFGMQQWRNPSKKGLLIGLGLAAFLLTCYFLKKPTFPVAFFGAPHLLIYAACFVKIQKFSKGSV